MALGEEGARLTPVCLALPLGCSVPWGSPWPHLVWVTLTPASQALGPQLGPVTLMPGHGLSHPTPISVQGTGWMATHISDLVTPVLCPCYMPSVQTPCK